MKKIVFLYFSLVSLIYNLCAQNWDSVGSGINGQVYALAVYNGELYAGGYFTRAGSVSAKGIAKWNGTSWSALSSGVSSGGLSRSRDIVNTIIVYNGNLYIGGSFDSAGGIAASNIAMWNGSSWSAVGAGIQQGPSYSYYQIVSFAIFNGTLYVGGHFDTAGGMPVNNIANWNGTIWGTIGAGVTGGSYTSVQSLVTYDSVLYAGGNFSTAGGNPAANIAQWNGSLWSALGSGVIWTNGNPYPFVSAMGIYNRNLYAGGYFDSAGGVKAYNIARWNGNSWDSAASGLNPYWSPPEAMLSLGGILYVGGYFNITGNTNNNFISSWNGTIWDSVGSGFLLDTAVFALANYDGQLYAGGSFRESGQTLTNNIARWGTSLGIIKIINNNSIALFPNPNNGIFTLQTVGAQNIVSATIEIYNVLGEKVYSQSSTHNSQFTIDLKQPSGIYLYRVISGNGQLIGDGKFIIEK